jgi:hypothetical protein
MKNRSERIEYITNTLSSLNISTLRNYPIPWRDAISTLPVIRLDMSYLMFWLDNSRTLRQQIEYQQAHPEQPNIFIDAETTIGQDAQYQILTDLLNESGKDIINDLEIRGQQDPAIITFDGFIINGNRRIAAMHILSETYADCVVLPRDAIKKDLYDLEQELQLSQDFKQPYHWINELLNLDHGLTVLNIPPAGMAKRLRISEKDIHDARRRKLLIDDFLEWKGLTNRYDYQMLDDTEQIFKELEKFTKSQKYSQIKIDQCKLAVFSLIENRPPEGRLYQHVKNLMSNFDLVINRLNNDNQIKNKEITETITDQKVSENIGVIDLLGNIINSGKIGNNEDVKATFDEFTKPENAKTNSAQIMNILEDVVAEKKEQNACESLYDGVDKALKILLTLVLENSSKKLDETKSKLNQILKVTYKLIDEIEKKP